MRGPRGSRIWRFVFTLRGHHAGRDLSTGSSMTPPSATSSAAPKAASPNSKKASAKRPGNKSKTTSTSNSSNKKANSTFWPAAFPAEPKKAPCARKNAKPTGHDCAPSSKEKPSPSPPNPTRDPPPDRSCVGGPPRGDLLEKTKQPRASPQNHPRIAKVGLEVPKEANFINSRSFQNGGWSSAASHGWTSAAAFGKTAGESSKRRRPPCDWPSFRFCSKKLKQVPRPCLGGARRRRLRTASGLLCSSCWLVLGRLVAVDRGDFVSGAMEHEEGLELGGFCRDRPEDKAIIDH